MELTPAQIDECNEAVEIFVFGNDLTARTDEEISSALSPSIEYNWQRTPYGECIYKIALNGEIFYVKMRKENCRNDLQRNMWIWNNRTGQPWHSHIEEYVARFRKKPRNFVGSLDLCYIMEEALFEEREEPTVAYWYQCLRDVMWTQKQRLPAINNMDAQIPHASPTQRVEAALRAMGAWPFQDTVKS